MVDIFNPTPEEIKSRSFKETVRHLGAPPNVVMGSGSNYIVYQAARGSANITISHQWLLWA